MDALVPSLRYAGRSLLRYKGVSTLAVLCMGLSIGTCVTLFTSINPWLFRPLPYPHSDRLVGLRETLPEGGGGWSGRSLLSAPNFLDWQARARSFETMGAFERTEYNLSTEGEPERVPAARVTATLLPTLGIVPVLGRVFRPEEDRPGSAVALVGHSLWQRRLGQDPSVLGRTLRLDGTLHTIVGVMPEHFAFPEYAEVWTPLGLEVGKGDRGEHGLDVVARLGPQTTLGQAQAELEMVAAALAREHPESNEGRSALVRPYLEMLTPPGVVLGMYLVLAAGLFVQLIASANVANLLLVKAAGQRHEIAVRIALGAGRGHVLRQFLLEAALLVGAGGALGLLLASLGVGQLAWSTPAPPFWARFEIDGRVVAFTIALTAASALVVSLVPALRAGRASVVEDLKEGGRTTAGGARVRLGRLLAVSELAAALVLLIGAALMVQSFHRRYESGAGVDTRGVLTARLALAGDAYREPEKRAAFVEELLRRVEALPDVTASGVANTLPFRDLQSGGWGARAFEIEGQPVEARRAPRAIHFAVTQAFTRATGIPLRAGRLLTPEEEAEGRDVALVSESLARRFWGGGEEALGERLRIEGGPWLRVVGVMGDVGGADDMLLVDSRPTDHAYVPYRREAPSDVALAVRARTDPLQLAESLRAALRSLDPALPLHSVLTLEQVRLRSAWVARLWGQMLSQVATLALVLAVLGVYGVVSYSVSQRQHEIGVRMAVGAGRGRVVRLVLGDGLRLALEAVALGLLGALAMTRSLSRLLYGVEALDPSTFAACALALVLSALLASGAPAWRATRVDPVVALRSE